MPMPMPVRSWPRMLSGDGWSTQPLPLRAAGSARAQGIPEPVEVHDLRWEPLDEEKNEDTVPLPARLTHVPLTGVVARETEAARLTDAYKRTAAGEGRPCSSCRATPASGRPHWCPRPPGAPPTKVPACSWDAVKKSQCAICALRGGAAPLRGACPENVLRTHVETHGSDIASMVPRSVNDWGKFRHPTMTDPDTERYLLYGAVAGILTAASAFQPTVLVLDDLQWSEVKASDSCVMSSRTVESARLLVLGSPGAPRSRHPSAP